MICQIRGTSGSGKSTVMRKVIDLMGDWNSVKVDGRKQPLYYRSASEWPDTVVLGHYESPCGGCDTIGSARVVYDLILSAEVSAHSQHVLCEGLLLSEDVKWTTELHKLVKDRLRVLFLTTPLERCLSQIGKRRADAGNDKPLNPANTSNRVRTIERARVKLTEAGVYCRRCSADQAPGIILNWLRLHAQQGDCCGSGTKLDHDPDRGG